MRSFRQGWAIQLRVWSALMIRELSTRFGRENIGFLWVMAEPLLFASLVGVIWRVWKGPEEHGIEIVAFVATGYIPLTLFRQAISRSVGAMKVNSSLLYHRQIKILDLLLVRFFLEVLGAMMAYIFIGVILMSIGIFPVPNDLGMFIGGWLIYCLFTLSLCLIVGPLSEMSEVVEKLIPVLVYVMIPFSGTFTLSSWLTPQAREVLAYSPPVSGMEMMRHGIFGGLVTPYYNFWAPFWFILIASMIGLGLCRRVRRMLIVE
jgi:capsular polysaccharide transport system permease protein